jgi:TPR repeat protein
MSVDLEELRSRAESGDPGACIALGDLLLARAPYDAPSWDHDGECRRFEQNRYAADFNANWAFDAGAFEGFVTWEQSLMRARLALDRRHEDLGRHTPGRHEQLCRATGWFARAAAAGDASAMYRLGWRYWLGQGVAADEAQAVAWWTRARERGDAAAEDILWRLDVIPYPRSSGR